MKTIEESVVIAMDGKDKHLYPYLPYILQDLWEIGASPEVVHELVKRHRTDHSNLKILDLGCGSGKHDILFAKENFNVCGVDMSEDMITIAKQSGQDLAGKLKLTVEDI